MSKKTKEYKRLPGRGKNAAMGNWLISLTRSTCSVWQGSDHLLLVDRMGFTETYKRFYFRDIQAVIIRKTRSGAVVSYVTGFLALVFLGWAFVIQNMPMRVTLLIIMGVFGLFALLNLLRGPTCVTHVKTAVQTEPVPAWNHVRTARKGMKKIRPLLLQAQPEVPLDEIKGRLEENLARHFQGPPADAT